jgi:hypothetical protein
MPKIQRKNKGKESVKKTKKARKSFFGSEAANSPPKKKEPSRFETAPDVIMI